MLGMSGLVLAFNVLPQSARCASVRIIDAVSVCCETKVAIDGLPRYCTGLCS